MAYSTITKPGDYFDTKLYTGDGTSSHAITGVGFQPDWVWTKKRSAGEEHIIYDSVRGVYKYLKSNGTDAESNVSSSLTSFDSDGFTLGSSWNTNNATYASWNWLAGGTPSSNSDGTITSSVSANTTAGFSVATFTGNGTGSATIGHGLGSTPKIVIIKNRGRAGESWQTWFDNDKRLNLNSTAVSFISTNPISTSSTLVTTPSTVDSGWNTSSDTYVMYSFAPKKGYSKFGTYTGNGNADGTFVYTGFKPAFVLLKNADGTYNWNMQDNKRDTFNPVDRHIAPNLSAAEAESSNYNVDFLSNGFKLRNNLTVWNGSGNEHIYMCFAENPLVANVSGRAIPATAR